MDENISVDLSALRRLAAALGEYAEANVPQGIRPAAAGQGFGSGQAGRQAGQAYDGALTAIHEAQRRVAQSAAHQSRSLQRAAAAFKATDDHATAAAAAA